MLTPHPLRALLPLLGGLTLAACGPRLGPSPVDDDDDATSGDDDDATPPPDPMIIVEVSPEPDETEVPVTAALRVRFDRAPAEVDLSLAGPDGTVALQVEVEESGTLYVAEPEGDLRPESQYGVSIAWSPAEGSLVEFTFTTAAVATPDEMEAAVGVVYATNLVDGTFVEPAGVGPLIQANLDDVPLMMAIREETDFAPEAQPAFHMIGAIGRYASLGVVEQGPCAPSIAMTAGPDEEYGTADDVPGTFLAPSFTVRPQALSASAQGIAMTLRDVVISGSYPPSLVEVSGVTISGTADTRPLDVLLANGGEGAICELLSDTVGLECFECGEPAPGAFCIDVVVEDLVGTLQASGIVERTCADVIELYETTFACGVEALAYDEDGDGTYELCPAWGG